jgi:Family of unknown function (DUF6188)
MIRACPGQDATCASCRTAGGEFALAEPALSWIRIDHQCRIQFRQAELVIECAFTLQDNGAVHELESSQRVALGPLVALYPDTITQLTMSPDSTLLGTFASGRALTVPHPRFEAWNIGGFWCPQGASRRTRITRSSNLPVCSQPGPKK